MQVSYQLILTIPFSFGLSYTTFKLSAIQVPQLISLKTSEQFKFNVSASVTNTGSVEGAEVVQVYVSLPKGQGGLSHPERQLRAFRKVRSIPPGHTVNLSIVLDKYALAHWDDLDHRWKVDSGSYGVYVGSSSNAGERKALEVSEGCEWSGL